MSEPITQPVNTLPTESSPAAADTVLTVKDVDGSLVRVALSAIKSLFGVPSASSSTPADLGTAAAGSSGDFARADHVHNKPTPADLGALPTGGGTMTGAIAMGGYKITGIGTPQNDGDASTKKYVDDAIAGLGTVFNIKGDVAAVSDLPASGNTVGDVYYVQAVSAAYVWLETTAYPTGYWEEFGEPIDLSGYIEKPTTATAGQFLVYNGTDWVAQTVPSANGVSF